MRWQTGNETTTAAAPAELDVSGGRQGGHEWLSVDIADYGAVAAATAGADVTLVLSVVRTHPVLAFDVNGRGAYNAVKAAVAAGHERIVPPPPRGARPPRAWRSFALGSLVAVTAEAVM